MHRLFLIGILCLQAPSLWAMPLPEAAGVVDVTKAPYFADSSGETDCTDALSNAMRDAALRTPGVFTTGDRAAQIIYLPAGTYRVSRPLVFASQKILAGRPKGPITKRNYIQGHMLLIGESREAVRIVVDDNSPAFAKGRTPVVRMTEKKFTNQDYFNWVMDLTIDVGSGNPGAVGLNFVSNNIGGVRDVRFVCPDRRQPAAAGLDLTIRGGGLGYVHRLQVDGFREGVRVGGNYPGFVLEDIQLSGQTEAGILNVDKCVSIRKLRSNNTVSAVVAKQDGCITVLLDSRLEGGEVKNSAIENRGHLYCRNIVAEGYGSVLLEGEERIGDGSLPEYVSGETVSLFESAPNAGLNLEIRDVPTHPWPAPDEWAVLDSQAQDDDTSALQALIDSGAEHIFVKADKGRLKLTDTIHVRGKLKRLHGGWGNMIVENSGEPGKPLFHFETGEASHVVLEAFANGQRRNTFTTFVHASEKSVVLRDLMMGYGVANYRNTARGDLYVENVVTGGGDYPGMGETVGPGWLLQDQRAWVRNWNPEDWLPDIRLEGAEVFALGGKLGEVWGTHLEVTKQSRAELLGFMLNCNNSQQIWFPDRMTGVSVKIEDSAVALTVFEDGRHSGPNPILVRETLDGQVRELKHSDAPQRSQRGKDESVVLPLYRSGIK